jgi:hypothetical protein
MELEAEDVGVGGQDQISACHRRAAPASSSEPTARATRERVGEQLDEADHDQRSCERERIADYLGYYVGPSPKRI